MMPTKPSNDSLKKKECKIRMKRNSLIHTTLTNRELTMMFWVFQRTPLLMKSKSLTEDLHWKIIRKTSLEIKQLKGNLSRLMKLTMLFQTKPGDQTMMILSGEAWFQWEPIISSKISWEINSSVSLLKNNSSSRSWQKNGQGTWIDWWRMNQTGMELMKEKQLKPLQSILTIMECNQKRQSRPEKLWRMEKLKPTLLKNTNFPMEPKKFVGSRMMAEEPLKAKFTISRKEKTCQLKTDVQENDPDCLISIIHFSLQ